MRLNEDNKIIRFLVRVFDLILLNILWTAFSLPVITAGAATAALYTVTMKMVKNEEGYIARDFVKAFRLNFRQSTIVWMILLVLGAMIAADAVILSKGEMTALKVLLFPAGIVYMTEVIFVFPLIATFENTTGKMMLNGLLFPLARLQYAAPVLIIDGACIVLTLLTPFTVLTGAAIWTIIGITLIAYINSFLIVKLVRPF